jgi:hypothetical protein
MDAINFVTGHINAAVLIIALALFLVHGLWHPWTDSGPFAAATVRHRPKLQCVCLAVIGFGLIGATGGTVNGWIAQGRDWILGAATDSAGWAFGGIAGIALAAAGVLIWIDYIVPEGMEPNGDKPAAHLAMWGVSLMLWPLMQIVFGAVSPIWFAVIYVAMWIFNSKFRSGRGAAVTASVR